jgi:hypothetical protein
MAHLRSLNPHQWLDNAVLAVSRLPSCLMLAVEEWRGHFQLECELADLAAHGALDRALADVGLSQSEIPRLLKGHPGAVRRLTEVMRRAGINAADLAHDQALKEIEWRCIECRSWRQCRAWLASNETGDGYRAFCPNLNAFDEIRRERVSRQSEERRPHSADTRGGGILNELETLKGQLY